MSRDRINVGVAHLSPELALDNPEAVHSVGVSQLQEYLGLMFGEDVPHGEHERELSSKLLSSMSALSTDEELVELADTDPVRWLPRWLSLSEPVVYDAKRVGKYVGKRLVAVEVDGSLEEAAQDFTYMLGLFDLASFVVSSELGLEHPRHRVKELIERTKQVKPAHQVMVEGISTDQLQVMDFLANSPLVPGPLRRRVINVRSDGGAIIRDTESYIAQVRAIVSEDADAE